MSKLSFNAIPESNYTVNFYTGWYKQVHFVHVLLEQIVLKSILKIISLCAKKKDTLPLLTWFVAKTTNFVPIWKVSWNSPTLSEDLSNDIWSYFCLFKPCIKQYCFICSSPSSTNLVILVQATISKYYMCKVWKLSDEYFLHDVHFKYSSFPQFCVQSYGHLIHRRFIHRLHPSTIYILMHNFIISYRAGFNLSLLKRAKNYL